MQYKTIVLELLRERTELHEQLRRTRRLLPTLQSCSQELRASHRSWIETLATANPSGDSIQIESEAMELAIKELEDRLLTVSPEAALIDEPEPLSLDEAMAFVASRTPKK